MAARTQRGSASTARFSAWLKACSGPPANRISATAATATAAGSAARFASARASNAGRVSSEGASGGNMRASEYPDVGRVFLRSYPATSGAGSRTPTLNQPQRGQTPLRLVEGWGAVSARRDHPARHRHEVDGGGGDDERVEDLVEAEGGRPRVRAPQGVDDGAERVEQPAGGEEDERRDAERPRELGHRDDGHPTQGEVGRGHEDPRRG